MRWKLRLMVLGAMVCLAVSLAQAQPIVEIDSGRIQGITAGKGDEVRNFKGIPFAAPPVGKLRWREPQPVEPWSGVRDCTQFGTACPQTDALARMYGVEPSVIDEDCLYLNVFTPAKQADAKLPVMLWFYGGGFSVGDAASYDMTRLAERGAIIVTVNYRVNIFGFFAHEALTRESPLGGSGNYGLLDMLAALQWIQRNIAKFGGNPDNVTIFGQSAGGSAVCHLMASPKTGGLIHRAISQSCGSYDVESSLAMNEAKGALFFKALGVDQAEDPLAAARAKTWQEIFEVSQSTGTDGSRLEPENRQPRLRFGVTIDGWLLVDQTPLRFAKGLQQNVPLMIGSNADESDEEFTSAARYYARKHRELNPHVFRYFFTQPSKSPIFAGRGAVHAAEIVYILRGNGRTEQYFDAQDWALSEAMSKAWIQFATTGDPNQPGSTVHWPPYAAEADNYLEFGPEIRIGSGIRTEICDRIDAMKVEEFAEIQK